MAITTAPGRSGHAAQHGRPIMIAILIAGLAVVTIAIALLVYGSSGTAVTQTRRPSTSASKSGRISSSSSIETLSSRTSSPGLVNGVSTCFRFEAISISQIPDRGQDQTQNEPLSDRNARYEYPGRDAGYSRQG